MDEKDVIYRMEINGLLPELNGHTLLHEIAWLEELLDVRFKLYFGHESEVESIQEILPPALDNDSSEYAHTVRRYDLDAAERVVLLLALLPHVHPQLLDIFFIKNKNYDRGYTEFGGIQGTVHGGFLPTAETAVFILAGKDVHRRLELLQLFHTDAPLVSNRLIQPVNTSYQESVFASRLQITPDFFNQLSLGKVPEPQFGADFPARKITTQMTWEDVVMGPGLLDDIQEVEHWVRHGEELLDNWSLRKWVKPGFRALFYGPSGTGKTMTACLLGKTVNKQVYRIDLSQVVSKYIGETEQNLARLFDRAEDKNWILFFDEADALFGKRGQTRNSNDRYANQEVAYLLQRIEEYRGLIILASNLQSNIDEAFSRRFQSMIYFPLPNVEERLQLWQSMTTDRFSNKRFLKELAMRHELSGGAMVNVVRYAALQAIRQGKSEYDPNDLLHGIKKELQKSGKTS